MLNIRILLLTLVDLIGIGCSNFDTFNCFNRTDGCATSSEGIVMAGTTMQNADIMNGRMSSDEVLIAGTMLAGMVMSGGTVNAGTVAGTEMGDMRAGTEMGGMRAGPEMDGILMPILCDVDEQSPLCTECNDEGILTPISDDDDCPNVDCPDVYRLENDVCIKYHPEVLQSCVDNQVRCATENECRRSDDDGDELYNADDQSCMKLARCTGSEEKDFDWGCTAPGQVCDQDDDCVAGPCSTLALGNVEHQLRVCSNVGTNRGACAFEYDYSRSTRFTCN